jgi:hypothetical protein
MESDGDVLDHTVAGRSVRESWALAEAALSLLPAGEGRWTLAPDPSPSNWVKVHRDASRNCKFQLLLFDYVYQKQAVPAACETCFKVKVVPRSLRELFAIYEAGGALPYTYKCGIDAESPITSGIYGAYFYVHGLPAARAAYAKVRKAVDEHPRLGPDLTVFIKRGCTEYEVHCGPSDQFTFSDQQREIEAGLRQLVQIGPPEPQTRAHIQQTFAHWIRTAYRLGDESYLDFTGGRRLYPAVVKYPTGESIPAQL